MTTLAEFRTHLFSLIQQNKLDKAFEALYGIYPQAQGEFYDELMVLAAQHRALRDETIAGIVDTDDAILRKNQLTHRLVLLTNQLEQDPVVCAHFGMPPPRQPVPVTIDAPSTLRSWLPWLIVVLVVALAGWWYIWGNEPDTPATAETDAATQIEQDPVTRTDAETAPPNIPANEPRARQQPTTQESSTSTSRSTPPAETPVERTAAPAQEPTVQTPPPPPAEPASVRVGQAVRGTIGKRNETDRYTFRAPGSGRYDITVKNVNKELMIVLLVYNTAGRMLSKQSTSRGHDLATKQQMEAGQTYYVDVQSPRTGSYSLSVQPE